MLDRDEQVITYVDTIDSRHSVRYAITVGANRPLYCTAAGRVLLAFADKEFQENYFRTVNGRAQDGAHDSPIARNCARSWTRSAAPDVGTSVSEMFVGSAAISAPVYGSEGKVVAAIAIGAPADRFEAELPHLREVIKEISVRASGSQAAATLEPDTLVKDVAAPAAARRAAASGNGESAPKSGRIRTP